MTIATQTIPDYDHVVRLKVPWSVYNALVDGLDEDNHARLTYDGELLEIMSPGSKHELIANLIADMIAFVTVEWGIDLTNFGSTTFKTKTRGFEADNAYYLDAHHRIRDIEQIDLAIDPPPDVVVEVDIASSSSNRLSTYAALGVPEVWRYDKNAFFLLALVEGNYVAIEASRIIRGLPAIEIGRRIQSSIEAKGDTLAIRAKWQQWLRENRYLRETA